MAATGTQTRLSSGRSRFDVFREPNFWEQLTADQRRGSLRNEDPVEIHGQQAWDVCGVVREKWHSILPSVQLHLNNRVTKIFRPVQGRQIAYSFSLYMTGTLLNFRPTVVASCMYLEVSKKVVKFIHEKLRGLRPRLGFEYLPTDCRIGPLMERSGKLRAGLGEWCKNEQGRMFRYLDIGGVLYTQWDHGNGPVVEGYEQKSTLPRYSPLLEQRAGRDEIHPDPPPVNRPSTKSQSKIARSESGRSPTDSSFPREVDYQSTLAASLQGRTSGRHATDPRSPVNYPIITYHEPDAVINARISKRPTHPPQLTSARTPRNLCGLAIDVKYRKDSIETVTGATMGGCVCINARCYGFTVAHVLSPRCETDSEPLPARASPRSTSWEADTDLSDLSESEEDLDATSAALTADTSDSTVEEFSWRPQADSGSWATVPTAYATQDVGLDLLIVPLGSMATHFENAIKLDHTATSPRMIYPKEAPADLPADLKYMTVVSGKSGNQRVRFSPTLSGIFLPSAGRVLSVWSVRHDRGAFRPGDSGSWAIGEEGDVYGYLVGTCEETCTSYVAPMAAAMAAIRALFFNSDVTLPVRSLENIGAVPERRRVLKRRETGSFLSRLGQEFSQIPLGNYLEYERFMAANPSIFEEEPRQLVKEAVRLAKEGRSSQARSCIQQSLLLRRCSKMSSKDSRSFFARMRAKDQKMMTDFISDCESTMNAVLKLTTEAGTTFSSDSRHVPDLAAPQNSVRQTSATLEWRRVTVHSSRDEESEMDNLSVVPDIRGTDDGDDQQEELDPRYYKRPNADKFFARGRVFALLWYEGAGESRPADDLSDAIGSTTGQYGQRVFIHIRRMAVVRERHGYCICVPINTYGGQGVLRYGITEEDRRAHSIIHSSNTDPACTAAEAKWIIKRPIAVDMASPEQKLDSMSRINFGKPYSVEWNAKVMNIGKVSGDSMATFIAYYQNENS